MENQLVPFEFQGNQIRIVMRDGEPRWVAKDVCDSLGYAWNGTRTIEHVPGEWRGIESVPTPSGAQDMAALSEQGLYFFLGRSDKQAALPFQKWIAGDVMPSIRKNGMYVTDSLLDDPEHLLKVTQRLVEERRCRLIAEEKVRELAPKAEFHDRVAVAKNGQSIGEAAKVLGTGQNRLFKWLRENGFLMGNNQPYQKYVDQGYFKVIEQTYTVGDQQQAKTKTLLTGKGLTWLEGLLRSQDEPMLFAVGKGKAGELK